MKKILILLLLLGCNTNTDTYRLAKLEWEVNEKPICLKLVEEISLYNEMSDRYCMYQENGEHVIKLYSSDPSRTETLQTTIKILNKVKAARYDALLKRIKDIKCL